MLVLMYTYPTMEEFRIVFDQICELPNALNFFQTQENILIELCSSLVPNLEIPIDVVYEMIQHGIGLAKIYRTVTSHSNWRDLKTEATTLILIMVHKFQVTSLIDSLNFL
jgi:hypothetical protein